MLTQPNPADVFGTIPGPTEAQIAASSAPRLAGTLPTKVAAGTVSLPTDRAIAACNLLHRLGIPATRTITREGKNLLVIWATDVERLDASIPASPSPPCMHARGEVIVSIGEGKTLIYHRGPDIPRDLLESETVTGDIYVTQIGNREWRWLLGKIRKATGEPVVWPLKNGTEYRFALHHEGTSYLTLYRSLGNRKINDRSFVLTLHIVAPDLARDLVDWIEPVVATPWLTEDAMLYQFCTQSRRARRQARAAREAAC